MVRIIKRHIVGWGSAIAVSWAAASTSAADPPAVEFAFVPAEEIQPDGPVHEFRISRFEIRNDQFVEFLNDALNNPDNERGQYMFFDTATGDVYVNTASTGQTDTDPGNRTIKMLSPGLGGQIEFHGESYQVVTAPDDYSPHPVSGVTWYGAVKYCNWLTIESGLPADERAYHEDVDSNPNGWRPVTISEADWAARDLTSVEREDLLAKLGYRLPMDGGGDTAETYNEWYKAAAWNTAAGVNTDYGFARDTITNADANFTESFDPFEPGTTPVGFFDGVNILADPGSTLTKDTQNGFRLYDISGNVWEWIQDQSPSNPARRRLRGGSWRDFSIVLRTDFSADRGPGGTDDATGFRVVQSVAEDFVVTPFDDLAAAGPWGGPYDDPDSAQIVYNVLNVTGQTVSFTAEANRSWVSVDSTGSSVSAGESIDVTVSISPECSDGLLTGDNVANVAFRDESQRIVTTRDVSLTVREPLTLEPAEGLSSQMTYGGIPVPSSEVYSLDNVSNQPVEWSSQTDPPDANWLTIGPTTAGTVPPQGGWPIFIAIDAQQAATLTPGSYNANVSVVDNCTGEESIRPVILDILAPFTVTPEDEVTSTGVIGGPFDPPAHVFTVENPLDNSVSWTVTICAEPPGESACTPPDVAWLELDTSGETTPANDATDVTASIAAGGVDLPVGQHSLTVRFEDAATNFKVERVVTVDVTGMMVEPGEDVSFQGPLGGPYQPASRTYTVRSNGVLHTTWEAALEFDALSNSINWLDVSPTSGIILDENDTDDVTLSIATDANQLEPGNSYVATITFTANDDESTSVQRSVTLSVGDEEFSVTMVMVPASKAQLYGPTYDFRIGLCEITNTEYVHFLNSAHRNALSGAPDERSQYMFFDPASGNVHISDGQGAILLDVGANDAIAFTAGVYAVEEGKEAFPVVGVSWYGALKFCNWMTITQGMAASERAYTEGPAAVDWAPVADQQTKRGIRLPMDDQASTASSFNEWYKAASRKPNNIDDEPVFGGVYGFGRDSITNADANFHDSGDPYEPGPTPVGYYDGINELAGGGVSTANTSNGYGIYDATGNVAEWVQDQGATASERGIRGGHFGNVLGSTLLRTDSRGSIPADAALGFVGFRIAQVVEPTDLRLTADPIRVQGIVGGPYTPEAVTLRIENLGQQTVDRLTITLDPLWLEIEGVEPGQVPPDTAVDVILRVAESAVDASVSPAPPGDFAFVSSSDVQTDGPSHDFWIARTEVTNSQFAAFLGDARSNALGNAPDVRSHYMFFDRSDGSVYVNDKQQGEEGVTTPSAVALYDASIGRIQFTGSGYIVENGYEDHPVVGVSWYGALKYCNWLTVADGIPAVLRAYTEGTSTNLEGWHPVVIANDDDWINSGINDFGRQLLIENILAYRLPMDHGVGGASTFNEWYKAASCMPDDQGNPVFGAQYGFGRSAISSTDANYFESGDTQLDGTTSVGFFDGIGTLYQPPGADCFPPPDDPLATVDTDNAYGLYDASGNVAEWTQEFGNDSTDRVTRGGSWSEPAEALNTTSRGHLAPEGAYDNVGFRLVRGTGHLVTARVIDDLTDIAFETYFILDLREPFYLEPAFGYVGAGMYRDTFAATFVQDYTLTNRSDADMDWQVSVNQDWIDLSGPVENELTGTLLGDDAPTLITVAINTLADELAPGTHTATVVFSNLTTGKDTTRKIVLTIDQPVQATATSPDPQEFEGVWGGPFDVPTSRAFDFTSGVDFSLDYLVSADQNWITIDSVDPLTGMIPASDSITIDVSINEAAHNLAVGEYEATLRLTWSDPANVGATDKVTTTVTLIVNDPVTIDPPADADPWTILNPQDPLPSQGYTLLNNLQTPVEVLIDTDVDWLEANTYSVEVLPGLGTGQTVTISLTDNALALTDGTYLGTVTFENTFTGILQCRHVEVTINETLSIVPFDGLVSRGALDGSPAPLAKVYTLTNPARDGADPINWSVSTQSPWLLVNGQTAATGTLVSGKSTNIVISIDANQLPAGAGDYSATIEFGAAGEVVSTKTVELTLVLPKFSLKESSIAASDDQFWGPIYAFNVATFPTINAEFVAFLNDARANLDNERGQHLYFDLDTGDVYINNLQTGSEGTGAPNATMDTLAYDATEAGRIQLVDNTYVVQSGFADHPVVGVSWYGAIKYCNWLTIDRGMFPEDRCYTEDVSLNLPGWHPVSIDTNVWQTRDLNDAERLDLVSTCRGFRLPMDDGYRNEAEDIQTDRADSYNEWYKAAAWDSEAGINHDYGFGRDVEDGIDGWDANYSDSGDPFDNGTTPVGYYDGSDHDGEFQTNPAGSQNAYGLYDITGNVDEWMQGRFSEGIDNISRRTIRGGAWNDPPAAESLLLKYRSNARPESTSDTIGFRVVRAFAAPTGDINGDGFIDLADFEALTLRWTGPGLDVSPDWLVFDLQSDGDIDLGDFAAFQVSFTPAP
ncbi:MAG: SUMF1/EgtB/PvdO family nonheme iron enzyme [Phycisphaerales bacterium]|nr:MAG: SUMF1/EgtB/PvdO family nonheme iron enzyme [Phycisphaerales bacterium]